MQIGPAAVIHRNREHGVNSRANQRRRVRESEGDTRPDDIAGMQPKPKMGAIANRRDSQRL